MIVSIHQPDYIPWLGFYYKVAHSDVFVYLDDAQFSNTAAHNFNYIKTPQGKHKLKIPVRYKFGYAINLVQTKDELGWKKKHLKTIEMSYHKAPFFEKIFETYVNVMEKDYVNLAALNIAINNFIFKGFKITTPIMQSSDMNIHSTREVRILDICEKVGATKYLSGTGASVYQKSEDFSQRGFELLYSMYKPINYPQLGNEFIPCMSVLDYIFNCGFNWDYIEKSLQ